MKKRDFNLVGNEGTDNQELAKGIAFVCKGRGENGTRVFLRRYQLQCGDGS